jgi:glyoxylase-like metal-dependent hydrolase (beta-lactamase superfamily II)/rhodanese-related sulfurtransferase
VLFRQFVDEDLGCASYLVGDPEAGVAVVVDPAFAIEQYLDAAAQGGVRIARVLETHTHADHVSGHGRLALEHGVPVSIHPLAAPEYPFDPLADGQVVAAGAVEVRVVHTPGHRPEHCAFVVGDELVLTGDSLFVGEAARPDLAIEARQGAADLFRSLHRLAELPDAVTVYPGHVAGSLCGTNMSPDHWTSIGRERETNTALRADEGSFVDASASLATPRPPTTELVVALNRGPWVAALPPLGPVEAGDATVLDVRPVENFVAGHLPGAVSVALHGGSFATRAAFVLGPTEPVVVVAGSEPEAQAAARGLRSVGLFEQRGYLDPGADAATETTPALTVPELAGLLAAGDVQLLDVREEREEAEGLVPGARRIPYRLVRDAPLDELDAAAPIYLICVSGARATLAASLLARRGFDARPVIGGGVAELLSGAVPAAARP